MPLFLMDVATSSTSAEVHQSTPQLFCVHLLISSNRMKDAGNEEPQDTAIEDTR